MLPSTGSHPAQIMMSVCPSVAAFFLFVVSKRKEWISDGADAVLKCGQYLPWQKRPAHMSRARKGTPETQKHEAQVFLQETCCPERQSGAGRRPEAQDSH